MKPNKSEGNKLISIIGDEVHLPLRKGYRDWVFVDRHR